MKSNQLIEERFKKMMNKVENLQHQVNKKRPAKADNIFTNSVRIDSEGSDKAFRQQPAPQMDYNSTLFRQIGASEAQNIVDNGSGVSNLSSVSNINHLLNHQWNLPVPANTQPEHTKNH